MGKKSRLMVIAASLAVVLTMAIGGVALAAGPDDTANNSISDNSGRGMGMDEMGNGMGMSEMGSGYGHAMGMGEMGIGSDNLTTLLGMTTEEIQTQRQAGLSLVQIAATRNVTEAQLVETIMAERQLLMQERVAAGTLTQENATLMLQNMEQNVVRSINSTTVGTFECTGNGGSFGAGNGRMTPGNYGNGTGTGMGTGSMNRMGNRS